MTWLAWRQYRIELVIGFAILAMLAAWLIPAGLDKHALFGDLGLGACSSRGGDCMDLRGQLGESYDSVNNIATWFNFLPGILGILLAAPLVSEFEQRTYRLAWTQSITRERWLLIQLGTALAGVAVFAVLLTLMMTWLYAPFDRTQIFLATQKDLGQSFDFEGAMPFVYTLFALSLALAAGAIGRRMLVAMPVALVGFTALRLFVSQMLRQDAGDVEIHAVQGQPLVAVTTRDWGQFWDAQAVEFAIFFAVAVVLLSVTVWAVHRRV